MRLRGGFGSLCDDVYTGFVEVFNFGEWGAVCDSQAFGVIEDRLIGNVVCRQLGFPHGSTIDPTANSPDPGPDEYTYLPFGVFRDYDNIEEAEEQQARFWLNGVTCRGPEERLVDCDLGAGFQQDNAGCSSPVLRVTVACRTFPIVEALESVTTPAAGGEPVNCVAEHHGLMHETLFRFRTWSGTQSVYIYIQLALHAPRGPVCANCRRLNYQVL